ncbi:MAG: lipopolysaccharide biosynthesis protein [Bacteroidales bacterium]|nr:lipopolysaccharide biosynthesis protein [Bacteroidales bacterium]
MGEGLTGKTVSGMLWSSIGKIGTMGITFMANLVLARLLMPSDFGAIAMLQVFIAISGIFVSGGLGSAIVQKKETTHLDYTTAFYFNLVVSILCYLLLFFTAPLIAQFYNMLILSDVLRVQSLSLIIQSFSIVQASQLQKQLRFKELSIRTLCATTIGSTVAIVMAFKGFGIWSLVTLSLTTSVVSVILLWKMSSWRPTLEFSWNSFKTLFNFGGLILLSNLVETIYINLQSLIIGKFYSASSLGYYNQAKKLEEVPTSALSAIVNDVSFPIFSSLQDEKERLLCGVRKNLKAITYLNFPFSVLLIIIANPLITLLYGPKWEASIPFFQILCISGMIYTINTLNSNVIKSLGKSKIFFFVQLTKRLIGIGLIILGLQFGIYGLLWAVTIFGYICFIVNGLVNKKLIGYGIWEQVKDVGACFLLSILLGYVIHITFSLLPINAYLLMFLKILVFSALYWLLSILFRFEGYQTYTSIIKTKLQNRLKK